MRQTTFCFAACLTIVGTVFAQDELLPPATLPQFVVISLDNDEKLKMSFPSIDTKATQTYTITVPFQEEGPDGEMVIKVRDEIRVREIMAQEPRLKKIIRWRAKDLKFLDLAGKELDYTTEIASRLSKPSPAIAITEGNVGPYFSAVLKPDTIVVVIPAMKPKP